MKNSIDKFIDQIEYAFNLDTKTYALFNIDAIVLVFLWHLFNTSRGDAQFQEYLSQYQNSETAKGYPEHIQELLVKKYSYSDIHVIKSMLWKKLDIIFEDMTEVVDDKS